MLLGDVITVIPHEQRQTKSGLLLATTPGSYDLRVGYITEIGNEVNENFRCSVIENENNIAVYKEHTAYTRDGELIYVVDISDVLYLETRVVQENPTIN